jgi:hypothetical protein
MGCEISTRPLWSDGRIDLANLLGERSVYPGADHTRTSNV